LLTLTGGSKSLPVSLPTAYYSGFKGCIRSLKIDHHELDLTSILDNEKFKYCH